MIYLWYVLMNKMNISQIIHQFLKINISIWPQKSGMGQTNLNILYATAIAHEADPSDMW